MNKNKKKLTAAFTVCLCAILLFSGVFFIWSVPTAYKPSSEALSALESSDGVKVSKEDFGYFFDGTGSDKAIIFYPGARVEYTAYAPLLRLLASNGIDCFAVKMPFNMAFFGMNSANDIMSEYSYGEWFVSGHSLGGAMAASYACEHLDELSGLVLLAAYPTSKIDSERFKVISIYGSEDGVLNFEKLGSGREFMPKTAEEVCIEGGNHAWFGNYGEQKGDGTALISREAQQQQTVEAITNYLK